MLVLCIIQTNQTQWCDCLILCMKEKPSETTSVMIFVLIFNLISVSITVSGSYNPDLCCFKFSSTPLNTSQVVKFQKTDALCPMEGVM